MGEKTNFMKKYCLCCFKLEEECCNHQFVEFPDECVCDKGEWLAFKDEIFEVNKICDNFHNPNGGNTCFNCEHDKGCHKE